MNINEAYDILGIPRASSLKDVKNAFRTLAKANHPDKNRNSADEIRFREDMAKINKAYKLLEGVLKANASKTFHVGTQPLQRPPPIREKVKLTLYELLTGVTKSLTVTVPTSNGTLTQNFNLEIEPGTLTGQIITIPEAFPLQKGMANADAEFEVCQVPHPNLIRLTNGCDLQYVAHISHAEAMLPLCNEQIPTLENKIIPVKIPGNEKEYRVKGRGLPHPVTKMRGDIVVVKQIKYDPPKEHNINISMEDVIKGNRVFKKVTSKDDKFKGKDFIVKIDIPPGIKDGAIVHGVVISEKKRISFPTVKFIVHYEKCPSNYKINGCNIEYTRWITKEQAQNGTKLTIDRVERGKSVKVEVPKKTKKPIEKKFSKKGLPMGIKSKKRGHFIVKIKIGEGQDDPIVNKIPVILENILYGLRYQHIQDFDYGKPKILEIEIKPGTKNGHKITFENEGPEVPGTIPSDLIFEVQYLRHKLFALVDPNGTDLAYTAIVTPEEINQKKEIFIPTLDDRRLAIELNRNKTQYRFDGYGLPSAEDSSIRGVLVVKIVEKDITTVDVKITLEEAIKGCQKRLKVGEKVVGFLIRPSTTDGEEFRQNGIKFIVRYRPHEKFDRIGDDIEYTMKVAQAALLHGVKIPTLEQETLELKLPQLPPPGYSKVYPGRGLPMKSNHTMRGNLIVRFDFLKNVRFNTKV